MAYYDQLAQFDNSAPVQQTFFITANVPQHYRGFLAVMIVLAMHVLLVAYVVTWFARTLRYSMLGNSWQGLSQLMTSETMPYLEMTSMRTDEEVKMEMEANGRKSTQVGLASIRGFDQVGIVVLGDAGRTANGKAGSQA
jgi:hypothetical protein